MENQISPEILAVLNKIRELRIAKDMTVLELSVESGVARSYLFYIEHKKKIPTLIVLDKLAKALGVSMRDFFE